MKRFFLFPLLLVAFAISATAQMTPEVYSWIRNTTGAVGYAGIPSNVQTVQYSASNVYVSCTCIPGYSIGPWVGNPNVAANQNFVFKITRNPQQNTGSATTVGLGHIGVWSNGVSIFNADDGQTYLNQGVWHRNAFFFEEPSFDSCLGHAEQHGEYHHHVNPKCLYDDLDSIHHSPIIGYSFDGFPVYGAYGYADPNSHGTVTRMKSSWQKRNITDRTTLPGGAPASSSGPAISSTYPLGAFIQDYEFVTGSGDLDRHNGRFCKTPDYPNGTYAYFVTIDNTLTPVYPFTIGDTYYGLVQSGNTGPGSGHNTITESTTVYTGSTSVAAQAQIRFDIFPNPATDYLYIYFDPSSVNNISGTLVNGQGQVVKRLENLQPSIAYTMDCTSFPAGVYCLWLNAGGMETEKKIVVTH
jgi:hypothetical protein